jgi:hypothetical protein
MIIVYGDGSTVVLYVFDNDDVVRSPHRSYDDVIRFFVYNQWDDLIHVQRIFCSIGRWS